MDINSREWYNKQKREKRKLVPDSAIDVSNHPVKEALESAARRTREQNPDYDWIVPDAQIYANRTITEIRTIISKVYTEMFSETTTSHLYMTDDEARVFMDWFSKIVSDHLPKAVDLVIEHRKDIRESMENE